MENQQHYIEQLETMIQTMKGQFDWLVKHPEHVKTIKNYSDHSYESFEALRMANPTPYTMECSLDILNEDNPKLECY